uniref:G-protein coupled receptors family 1 profile domain-containing protein n=1 Tax=Nannospalax galili TaxID=1026970 RepID=A0A8C6Q833_NANGA
MRNHSMITKLGLLGIPDNPELQIIIFIFLKKTYILSICGNLIIMILTFLDSQLKTTMYFFFRNFSYLEIIFPCVSIPRFVGSIITKVKTISYNDCLAQLFFFISMGVSEFFLLTAVFKEFGDDQLLFCLCDSALHLSIGDSVFYLHHRHHSGLPSASQRKNAFSTCSSHMTVISISYGSCIFMYVKTSAKEGVVLTKGVAVLNTSVAPMLNPFIYSLRNQQVKRAFKNLVKNCMPNK